MASLRWRIIANKIPMSHPIEALRARIEALTAPGVLLPDVERLSVVTCGTQYHVEFFGNSFGDAYLDLCETLSSPDVAASILSLSLRGIDEGANGTKNWDLEPLVSRGQEFPFLQTFSVELNQPADHNRTIVASSYEEDGVIARFVSKCPRLVNLTVPSAPSSEFFNASLASLRFLSVDAGYDTQDFLRNFGRSGGFSSLLCFEWGEYSENYIDNWQESCTPFSDYEALFTSPAFHTVKRFVLRQPSLTADQIAALRMLRPELQFLVVRYSSEYARSK